MRPVIGITTRPRVAKTSAGELRIDSLQHTYRDAVERAGGIPLPLGRVARRDIPRLLNRIDGLVLTGGGDISPAAYNGHEHGAIYGVDAERDAFEFALTHGARERCMPLLAICRGLQVINVALGGTLIEDIPSELGTTDHAVNGERVFTGHQLVTLDPTCALAKIVESATMIVNSIHHQAVRRIAPGMRAVGTAEDGIVEAIEPEDPSWPLLAVQWHPEYLSDAGDAASNALFAALVDAARSSTVD